MKFAALQHIPSKRLIYLLISIILFLAITPFFYAGHNVWLNLTFAGLVIPFLAVWLVADHRFNLLIATALAIPLVVVSWLSGIDPSSALIVARYVFAVLFYGFAVYMVLHYIHQREVTVDVIVGSVSSYLLIGIMWAYVYQIINLLQPGAFLSTVALGTGSGSIDFFYYSFVALTTLGFGDIIPVSSVARSFTALEAITGVLFTAVVIARVIGLYVAKRGSVIGDVVDALKK